jgi:hypothetical protein
LRTHSNHTKITKSKKKDDEEGIRKSERKKRKEKRRQSIHPLTLIGLQAECKTSTSLWMRLMVSSEDQGRDSGFDDWASGETTREKKEKRGSKKNSKSEINSKSNNKSREILKNENSKQGARVPRFNVNCVRIGNDTRVGVAFDVFHSMRRGQLGDRTSSKQRMTSRANTAHWSLISRCCSVRSAMISDLWHVRI